MSIHTRGLSTGLLSSVLGSVTVGLEEFIEVQGANSAAVLARAGLRQGLYQQPNRHIPLKFYCNSMHEAARATGNEHFGLWFGEQFRPEGLGLFGYYAITSPDVRSAIAGMERYFHVFQRNSLLQCHRSGMDRGMADGIVELEYRLLDGDIPDRRQDAELTIGMLNNVLKRGMGLGWTPVEVHFQHPALVDATPHRDAFHCDVRFGQPRNVIRFRQSCLDQPMPDANPMLNNISLGSILDLEGRAALQADPGLSLVQRLRSEVIERLPHGDATLEDMARRLNRSSRSLQRQLAEQGCSFKSVLDSVREDLAEYYLNYDRLSVSEVAYRLGYSEVSAFTRAFVRWKHINPSEWRGQSQPLSHQ
ncbi:AraC family transcriptional regulator [Candidatus Thalassolituus haligoni]|uniref:AraC-like transcriptional regulator QhpR n=1 Tax=Candidatus Thalassolituus haligoni TaxID=3100113 RepID=UPI003519532E|tara:strand:- start:919 stop:2004 length:1086 start_codon:yes stop_codon:yes gene_type:complete